MATGNVTFEETLGLLTGATEITRSASKAARGLTSIQSRLNQIVEEGSTVGKALTSFYEEHEIAIYDQEGQLRSLYDILQDVSKIWPKLTRNEKAYYLNNQAGETMPLQGGYAGTYLEPYVLNYSRNVMAA